MLTIYGIGPTNAGKSTFLRATQRGNPAVGLIEVGKILRAKYPPPTPEHLGPRHAP